MKKHLMILLLISVVVALLTITASAASVSDLTYVIKDGEVTITDCDENATGDLVIPETIDGYPVTEIDDRAFFNCSQLTSVTMPDSVTTVGGGVFYNCKNLKNVTLPKTIHSLDQAVDGGSAGFEYYGFFESCSSLKTITIPDSVTYIDDSAFTGCSSLPNVDLPNSVTYIGDSAFSGCSSLTKVTIPTEVTYIGTYAFFDCTSLTEINIPDGVKTVGKNAFLNTAYYNNESHWVNGLLYLDDVLINSSQSITEANIAAGTRLIADSAFDRDEYLSRATIPNSVTSIGDFAFAGCKNLPQLIIPNSVIQIGRYAFKNCTALASMTIPDSVTSTGCALFYGCSSLEDVKLSKNIKSLPYSFDDNLDALDHWQPYHSDGFFEGCKALRQIKIPDGVAHIGDATFEGCSSLTTVEIPDGVTEIYDYAFLNCTALKDVTIPDSLRAVGYGAFDNCIALKDVYYAGTQAQWNQIRINTDDEDYFNELYDNQPLLNATIHYNYAPFAITTQPVAVSTVAGKTAVFKVAAAGADLTYQWQYKAPNGSWTNSPADGNRTATLKVPATVSRNAYQYRCVIKSGDQTLTSKAAKLTVFGIKTQPTSVSSKVDKAVNFRVVATGPKLTYQWQYKAPNGKWTNSPATGNQTATLSVPVTMSRNGYQYRCVVKSGNNTVNSKAATLTVFGIKTQPKSISTTAGKDVTMKVVATGKNLTYQWQYKTPSGDWKNSVGEGNQTNTLTIHATTGRHNYQFRCIVKSGSGKITTNVVKLTAFGIKTQPTNITAKVGSTATFKVVATGSNLTYQWQYKAPGGSWKNSTMNSANSATLKIPATNGRNNYQFRCIVKSGSNSVTSNVVKLTVKK